MAGLWEDLWEDIEKFVKRLGLLIAAFFVCVAAFVLIVVQHTHFVGGDPRLEKALASNIKSKCASYITQSSVVTVPLELTAPVANTGILINNAQSTSRIKIAAVSTSVSVLEQNKAHVSGTNGVQQRQQYVTSAWDASTGVAALSNDSKLSFFNDDQSHFDTITAGTKTRYDILKDSCDKYGPPEVLSVLWYYVDAAEAISVMQTLAYLLFFSAGFVFVHEILMEFTKTLHNISLDDVDVAGFNTSSNTWVTVCLIGIWSGITFTICLTSGTTANVSDSSDWTAAVLSPYLALLGFMLCVVLPMRWAYEETSDNISKMLSCLSVTSENQEKSTCLPWFPCHKFLCCFKYKKDSLRYTLFFRIFTNFTHIWLSCVVILVALLILMTGLQERCDEIENLSSALDNMHNFVNNTVNSAGVTGWVSQADDLHTTVKDFTTSGSCDGIDETAWVLFWVTVFPLLVLAFYPFVLYYGMNEKSVFVKEDFAKYKEQDAAKASSESITELHPLNADTLNF